MLMQPKLRFKQDDGSDFPDWEKSILGDYGKLIKGLIYSPKNIVENGLLVLRSSNVQNNILVLTDNVFVNLKLNEYKLTKIDDIIICVRNGSKKFIGKNAIVKNQYLPTSTHGAFMANFRGESNKFVFQWFQTQIYKKHIWKNLGATINSINNSDLKKFRTVFPLEPEQQKIASFLSSVDKKIELLTKKYELLEKYKKGLMQKIFSQEIRFKQDDGSDFPDWEESFLEKKIFLQSGFPFKSKYFNGSDKKVLRIGDIKKNIRCELFKGIFTNEACEDKYKVNENDFVIALSGATFGKIGKVKDQEEYFINQRVAAVRTKENLEFFFQLFDSELFKKYLLSVPSIGAQSNISNGDIYKFSSFFPTVKEQQKIASFLSALDKKIDLVKQQIEKTQTFKKGLLQQMFI